MPRTSTVVVLLFLAIVLAVFAQQAHGLQVGCCATTVCEDSDDQTCPASGIFYSGQLCTAINDCGCCVCNPDTSPFVFSDNIYSSSGCVAACAARGATATKVVPGLSVQECQGLGGRTVTGAVKDQTGASLFQTSITSSNGRSANTGVDGKYTLTLVNNGNTITASYRGLTSTPQTITSTKSVYDFLIQIPVTATVKGTVKDKNGIAVSGVVVSVDFTSATSSSTGAYEIKGLQAGTYTLTASKTGFPPYSQSVTVAQGEVKTVDIILVSGAATLSGTVKDSSGTALGNVVVRVQGYPDLYDSTDSTGAYSIPNTPIGTITVTATPPSSNYVSSSRVFNFSSQNNVINFVLQSTGPCSDGTPRGLCSSNKPKFCTSQGLLIDNFCSGSDQITGTADDCGCPTGYTCEVDGVCKALEQRDCCSYSFQCYGIIPPAQASCPSTKVGCAYPCYPLEQCPVKIAEKNVIQPVCQCGSEEVNVAQNAGKFCCELEDGSFILTDKECEFGTQAEIKGYVRDRITGLGVLSFVTVDAKSSYITMTEQGEGYFDIFVSPDVSHILKFQKPGYRDATVNVGALDVGELKTIQDVFLDKIVSACSYPTSTKVPQLLVQAVKCKSGIKLTWNKDFCDNVQGFVITRETDGYQWYLSKQASDFTDSTDYIKWNTTYNYSIQAFYTDTLLRYSAKTTARFTTGNAECANRCTNDEFCADSTKRAKCDANNRLITASTSVFPTNCADLKYTGTDWFCAGPNNLGVTWCAQSGGCGQRKDFPFYGLFYTPQNCYTFQNKKQACYFDSSFTTIDFCFNCLPKANKNASCYLYKSELACNDNNCGYEGCDWLLGTSDFKSGLCYDKRQVSDIKYNVTKLNLTSRCELCSNKADVFQNKNCFQDTCSKLGLCYSVDNSCEKCSATASCADFKTVDSCIDATGKMQRFRLNTPNAPETATYSDDACGLGRCAWNGTMCFKDGNSDDVNDCPLNPRTCLEDNKPPESRPGFKVTGTSLNAVGTELTFNISEPVYAFYFCIGKVEDAKCQNFILKFPDSSTQKFISINPVAYYPEIMNSQENYLLRYYAEDVNRNKELIKESQVYIDPVAPQIDAAYFVRCINCQSNVYPKTSNVEFTIFSNEVVNCTDTFSIPPSSQSSTYFGSNSYKKTYPLTGGIDDGFYDYTLVCEDAARNKAIVQKTILVDSYIQIATLRPRKATRSTDVIFNAETSDKAGCGIKIDSSSEILMTTQDSYNHSYQKQLLPNTYHYYQVRCVEQESQNIDVANAEFSVDLLAPVTKVFVNNRQIITSRNFWTDFENSASVARLQCEDPLIQGKNVNFGCNTTKYCVTTGTACQPYLKYNASINIANLSTVCYMSADNGGNQEILKCGRISVDGTNPPNPLFNITLKNPARGVGNAQQFDLVVETNKQGKCGYQKNIMPFMFSFTTPFDRSNFITHTITSFSAEKLYPLYQNLYVWCEPNDPNLPDSLQMFRISYDTTPPNILRVNATPAIVKEYPLETAINVFTDDETTCRYGEVFDSFETAAYAFPSPENYLSQHSVLIGGLSDGGKYNYKVICRNLAGLNSPIKPVSFSVDLSLPAAINIITPRDGGFYNETSLPLDVRTDKRAQCIYSNNENFTAESTKQFDNFTADLKSFRAGPFNFTEGKHKLFVQCMFGTGAPLKAKTEFVIDLTGPVNLTVNDGDFSCSKTNLNITWTASDPESGIQDYLYIVMPKASIFSDANASWQTTTGSKPETFPSNITGNITYKVVVKARNKAGMVSSYIESDGFVIDSSRPECAFTGNISADKTPPTILVDAEATDTGGLVTIRCMDNIACNLAKLYYGFALAEADCDPVTQYTEPFEIFSDSYVCWDAQDTAGNKNRGSQLVQIPKPQECAGDKDCDGMPDDWETQYGLNPDVNDAALDSDNDGLTNLEEYRYGTDPTKEDTDGDGYSDYDEIVVYHTNPLDAKDYPKSYLWLWILLIIVALLVLGGAGYYFYSYYTAKQQQAQKQQGMPQEQRRGVSMPGMPSTPQRAGREQAAREEILKKIREMRRAKIEEERQKIFEKFGKPGEVPKEKKKEAEQKIEHAETVFDRLENLAKKESDFDRLDKITNAVKKKGAFDRLVEITAAKKSAFTDIQELERMVKPRAKPKSKTAARKKK